MSQPGYKQFCPVAMASEILCTRWTIVVLRELIVGTTRFNDLRRAIPRISPALLSQRLKQLEEAGVVARKRLRGAGEAFEYQLTEAGRELEPLIVAMGVWGHRWIEKDAALRHLDPAFLMWDMRRNINADPLPDRRCIIHVSYPEQPPARRAWWLVVEADGAVDLCSVDPGFDVDVYLSTDLRTMTEIWMGYDTIKRAQSAGRLHVTGDKKLAAGIEQWMKLSVFAKVERRAS